MCLIVCPVPFMVELQDLSGSTLFETLDTFLVVHLSHE